MYHNLYTDKNTVILKCPPRPSYLSLLYVTDSDQCPDLNQSQLLKSASTQITFRFKGILKSASFPEESPITTTYAISGYHN
jgi:hypothetical protein